MNETRNLKIEQKENKLFLEIDLDDHFDLAKAEWKEARNGNQYKSTKVVSTGIDEKTKKPIYVNFKDERNENIQYGLNLFLNKTIWQEE